MASLLSHSDPAPRLLGRTALVTGAARGIGLAISRRLRAEGAAVALLDLDGEALAVAAAELGGEGDEIATAICDVRDSAAVDAAVASAARALGSLDVIVNNAGLARDGRLGEMSDDDWDLVLEVDLRGAFYCSRAAAPYLAKSEAARIVNISSRAHLGNPGQANYSAAKAGVIGMTRALSLELGRDRITVNAVAPGMIDTDLVRSHPKSDAIVARAEKATPLGRIGTPAEVAAVVAFLASDDAAYVSGEVIHVTGGR